MPKTIGFIGKKKITDEEERLLYLLGRTLARAGNILVIVPQPGAINTVQAGVKAEGGSIQTIDQGVISASAHTFVYADEQLMKALRKSDPAIDSDKRVFLLTTTEGIQEWLSAAKAVLEERGITWPED